MKPEANPMDECNTIFDKSSIRVRICIEDGSLTFADDPFEMAHHFLMQVQWQEALIAASRFEMLEENIKMLYRTVLLPPDRAVDMRNALALKNAELYVQVR